MTFIAGEFRNYDAAESRNGDSDSSLQLDQKTTGNNQSLPTRWLMRQMRNSIPAGTVPRISTTSTAIDVSASSTTEPPSSAEQQVLETF
jgi:hypothetical protein